MLAVLERWLPYTVTILDRFHCRADPVHVVGGALFCVYISNYQLAIDSLAARVYMYYYCGYC